MNIGGGGRVCPAPPTHCILQKCVIAEWPGWFVFEKRLKVVKITKTDFKMAQNGQNY